MSASGFNIIRRHSFDATGVRIKELTQALATNRSKLEGSQLETDDIRSQGRMDHSTIKLNDERLSFGTVLSSSNTDYHYMLPNEPDLRFLRIWFMMDHLGARIRDISGFQNDAFVAGHPTLRRAFLNIGFQQLETSPATPVMLFNSGTDAVSQIDGEYIYIPDNGNIRFTNYPNGFTVHFRFNCLNFNNHTTNLGGLFSRRFASKTDDENNGWSILVYPTGTIVNDVASHGGVEVEITDNGIQYARRTAGYSAGLWYQVIVTYDRNAGFTAAERIKIYTGGLETSMDSSFGTILATTTNLRIGARSSGSGFFHGYIQDFRMYFDKVLTQQEVINLSDNDLTISSIPKGHTFVVQYALVQQAILVKTHKWQTVGRIIKVRFHKFNVIELVIKPKIHKWNLYHRILPLRTHKFTIVELVMRLLTLVYDQGGLVSLTKTHKFNIVNKLTVTKTHKYNLGGLQTQYQRFVKSTTAGSNITQAITFNSTPKALIVWSDGTAVDNTFTNDVVINYGFSDGTHHACVTGLSEDGQTTTDTFSGHKSDAVIAFTNEDVPSTTPIAEATVSFSSNQAVFNWTTNDTRATYIHCLAIWGVENVEVKTFENGTTSTGNKVYTLNNTSMTPTFLHTITVNATGAGWTTSNAQAISIGAATSATKQFAIVNVNEDGQAGSDVWTAYLTDHVLLGHDDDTGTQEFAAKLSSFGTGNGQFTLNYTDPRSVTTIPFSVLVMDSPNIDVGLITQPAATGTQVVNVDTNVNSVKGLMIFSNAQTSGTLASTSQLMIGGASGTGSTAQGLTVVGENDGVASTETARINRTGKVIKTIAPNNAVLSTTTTSEADLSSVSTQDQFTLNWTTANATARKFHYIVFGS
jgi:hypothetical protein